MKLNKKILFGLSLGLAGIALASCSTEKYNQVVPYGTLEGSFDTKIATANGDLSMNLKQYYSRLRNAGYDVVENAINKQLFKAELACYKDMLFAKTINELQDKENTLKTLALTKDNVKLYEITDEKYAELREELLEEVNTSLASAIFSTGVEETINNQTEKEKTIAIKKFVNAQNQLGVELSASDIAWFGKSNPNYTLKETSKLIQFEDTTLRKLSNLVDGYLLTEAQKLSAKKALYEIADKEYIYDSDKEDDIKNSNYLFSDKDIKAAYNNTYKTYGTYKAVVIQFNTLKEALDTMNKVTANAGISSDADVAKTQYLGIYNSYYSFKDQLTDAKSFVVSKDQNELSDFSSSIQTLIKETLEDNEYLLEPRNFNNKYVLVYKFDTEYDLHSSEGANKQLDFDKLSEEQLQEYTVKIKEDILDASVSSYLSVNKQNLLEDSNIKIYDPLFESKFYYANSSFYERITDNVSSTSSNIFSIGDYNYTVNDFYDEASLKYASSIINEHLTLEYTYKYYDQYVNQYYISSELHDTNVETLESDISSFEAGKKSQYPTSYGLSTYLLGNYGYETKEDVIKYYYDARQARTTYLSRYVFEEWSDLENNVTDVAKTGFLNKLLETGNENYKNLFEINLDHILINIDDDGDGSPDDPNKFLADNPAVADEFKEAVAELAVALYQESINEVYSGNTLYEILTHIKSDFQRGETLKSDNTKTWDDFKKFNFLLTVEKLASSSNITESTVSSFVTPFADYVKNVYKFASSDGESKASTSNSDGVYYFVYTNDEGELTGHTAKTLEDSKYITYDSLCMTNYGYHMLILNSYTKPRETISKESDDSVNYLKEIKVILHKYTDDDDKEVSIYAVLDGYNEDTKDAANFNQFFIYYVQKQNGDSSSLESNIYNLLCRMFDNSVSTFNSSNFQNYLLAKTLDVKINTSAILNVSLKQLYVDALVENYELTLTNYGTEDTYESWLIDDADDLASWARPDKK